MSFKESLRASSLSNMNANPRMRTSYVPVMHCEKMAVTDMSFRQRAVIEFLAEEGNSAAVIYERPRGVYGDVYRGASSVRRRVKHFKDGNTDIADQPRCGVCILIDFSAKGETINAARYVQTLNRLCRTLREKRLKKKTVILQRDNARPHTARPTLQTIQKNCWELLTHPPYGLDLPPSDCHLFGPLKDHLRGHH
jgi:hypothetical protein